MTFAIGVLRVQSRGSDSCDIYLRTGRYNDASVRLVYMDPTGPIRFDSCRAPPCSTSRGTKMPRRRFAPI